MSEQIIAAGGFHPPPGGGEDEMLRVYAIRGGRFQFLFEALGLMNAFQALEDLPPSPWREVAEVVALRTEGPGGYTLSSANWWVELEPGAQPGAGALS